MLALTSWRTLGLQVHHAPSTGYRASLQSKTSSDSDRSPRIKLPTLFVRLANAEYSPTFVALNYSQVFVGDTP